MLSVYDAHQGIFSGCSLLFSDQCCHVMHRCVFCFAGVCILVLVTVIIFMFVKGNRLRDDTTGTRKGSYAPVNNAGFEHGNGIGFGPKDHSGKTDPMYSYAMYD